MRVAFINTVCGKGSTGRICTVLAEHLLSKGHEVLLVHGRGDCPDSLSAYSYRMENELSLYSKVLEARLRDNDGFLASMATKKMLSAMDSFSPDIVHLHNLHGYYIDIRMLFEHLNRSGRKVIWTFHDCWPFTGHCVHMISGCSQWMNECRKCPCKSAYPKSVLLERAQRNFSAKRELYAHFPSLTVVTPCHWLKRLMRQSMLSDLPTHVIHNGIDTTVFHRTESEFRQKYGLEKRFILIGVAPYWTDTKGFRDFIQLSELLSPEQVIVLVGLTEAQRRGLPPNILGLGRTADRKELAGLYSTSDVLLNLSHYDTFPTVNLEAQACGIPVITYNTGGSVESVPAENVVSPGDFSAIIERIRHPLQVSRLDFSEQTMADQYLSLYRSV